MLHGLVALAWYTAKASFSGRRMVGLGLIALVPVALAFTGAWLGGPLSPEDLARFLLVVGVGLVVPLLALIVGVGALRDDVESGAIVHLITKPVPREAIVATRVLTAALVTYAAALVALSLPLLVTGQAGLEAWWLGARVSVLASFAYASLFAFLGVLVARAALVGLLYLVAWEIVVASTPFFFRFFTIAYWIRSIMVRDAAMSPLVEAELLDAFPATTGESLAVLAGVVVVFLAAGMAWFGWREFAGPEPDA